MPKILRTAEFKLYPNMEQVRTLDSWLRRCCWVYNRALEQRIKAYQRRGDFVTRYTQQKLLTQWRKRMRFLREVPVEFARGALCRVDVGMKAFFRRVKAGDKPGFPRFRSHRRYNSLECLDGNNYLRDNAVWIPGIGWVSARGRLAIIGTQKVLRVIRRASGWYAQVVVDSGDRPSPVDPQTAVGIDVGLNSFAALSDGERIENPRFYRKSEKKLKSLQRRVSRKQRQSANRRRATQKVARQHERIAAQRKDFAHQASRKVVNEFELIGFEKLNIRGLARTRLAKSIMDAAWGIFLYFVTYKAAYAGKHAVPVDSRGTSQECPYCGAVAKKSLSERIHHCPCGADPIDRDFASALVIRARAVAVATALYLRRDRPLPDGEHRSASQPDETGSSMDALHQ